MVDLQSVQFLCEARIKINLVAVIERLNAAITATKAAIFDGVERHEVATACPRRSDGAVAKPELAFFPLDQNSFLSYRFRRRAKAVVAVGSLF